MILKFKDSRNNWKYVTLGDFVVNKINISEQVQKIVKKYTIEELTKGNLLTEVVTIIKGYMRDKLDLYLDNPHIDENVIHKLNDIVIIQSFGYDTRINENGYDGLFSSKYLSIDKTPCTSTYIISDECYLMNDDGKTIEKLM